MQHHMRLTPAFGHLDGLAVQRGQLPVRFRQRRSGAGVGRRTQGFAFRRDHAVQAHSGRFGKLHFHGRRCGKQRPLTGKDRGGQLCALHIFRTGSEVVNAKRHGNASVPLLEHGRYYLARIQRQSRADHYLRRQSHTFKIGQLALKAFHRTCRGLAPAPLSAVFSAHDERGGTQVHNIHARLIHRSARRTHGTKDNGAAFLAPAQAETARRALIRRKNGKSSIRIKAENRTAFIQPVSRGRKRGGMSGPGDAKTKGKAAQSRKESMTHIGRSLIV